MPRSNRDGIISAAVVIAVLVLGVLVLNLLENSSGALTEHDLLQMTQRVNAIQAAAASTDRFEAVSGPASVQFRFKPLGKTSFRVDSVRTKFKVVGGRTLGEESIRTSQRVTVSKVGNGITFYAKPIAFTHTRDGPPPTKIDELVASFDVTYHVAGNGTVTRVEGYDEIESRAAEILPRDQLRAVAAMTPSALREARKAEWMARVGDLVGLDAQLEDQFVGESVFPLPGGPIQFYSVITFGPWVSCGKRRCITVTQNFDSDPVALSRRHPEVRKELDGKPRAAEKTRIHGNSVRIVDPGSMSMWSESSFRTIELDGNTMTENQTLNYTYDSK